MLYRVAQHRAGVAHELMAWVWIHQEFGGKWIEIQLNVSHYPSVHPLFTTLPNVLIKPSYRQRQCP